MPIDIFKNLLSNPPSSSGSSKFGIDSFSAEIGKNGVAKVSNFLVEIQHPKLMQSFQSVERAMPLRIEQITMPARQILSFDQNYYGPVREIPYRYISVPVTMTIILSEDMREREYFMQWQDLFIGPRRVRSANPTGVYDCGYFKENVGTVTIKQYGESPAFQGSIKTNTLLDDVRDAAESFGFDTSRITSPLGFNLLGSQNREVKELYRIELVEAYPQAVYDIPMNWGDDSYGRLTVDMRYTYTIEDHPFTDVNGAETKSFLRKTVEAFQRFKPIFGLIKSQGARGAVRSTIQTVGQDIRNAGKAAKSIFPF